MLNVNDTAVLVIDIQEKLVNAIFNKDIVTKKSEILTKVANILNLPIFLTEQYPKGLGETIPTVKSNLPENHYYSEKVAFNALEDRDLLDKMRKSNCKNIIVLGIETHICVYQTLFSLKDEGFDPVLVSDCCGSRSEFEYQSALDLIKNNNIDVKTTEMIIFELLKTAKHPNFKEIQSLIK